MTKKTVTRARKCAQTAKQTKKPAAKKATAKRRPVSKKKAATKRKVTPKPAPVVKPTVKLKRPPLFWVQAIIGGAVLLIALFALYFGNTKAPAKDQSRLPIKSQGANLVAGEWKDCTPKRLVKSIPRPEFKGHGIIGGHIVQSNLYPSNVRLEGREGTKRGWGASNCTGTLIDGNQILTAAHCLVLDGKGDFVFAGEIGQVVKNKARTFKANILPVAKAQCHSSYKKVGNGISGIDLMVLQLNEVQQTPVAKIYPNKVKIGMELKFAGWGVTKQRRKGSLANKLRAADLTIDWVDYKQGIFTAEAKGGRNLCNGDSGGGAYWQGQLVGVLSAVEGRFECGSKAIFTVINPYFKN